MALCLGQVFSKDKTFRPRKRFEPGTQRFELYKRAQASLKSGLDLRKVVQLPDGENINDWIAVHVVDFFNRINLIYGTVSEFCTEKSCPIMSGGPRYEYRWQDGDQYKRPTKLPALIYMNLLMNWIESLINNEDIFPTRVGLWCQMCFPDIFIAGIGLLVQSVNDVMLIYFLLIAKWIIWYIFRGHKVQKISGCITVLIS